MDLRKHYAKVRQVEESLPTDQDSFYVTSKDTETGAKAGLVIEVNRSIAARAIAEGTHALATDKEVEQFHKDQADAAAAIAEAEFSKKQTVNLKVVSGERPEIERPRTAKPSPAKPAAE